MTKLDKVTVGQIRKDMDAALLSVAQKHGLTFSIGRISFNADSFRGRVQATLLNASTVAQRPSHTLTPSPDWIMGLHRHGVAYGLNDTHLHKDVPYRNEIWQFMGMLPRATTGKFIVGNKRTGKFHRVDADIVKKAFGL